MTISWVIPLKTISEVNSTEHWSLKAKRHKHQQRIIRLFCNKYAKSVNLPCSVHLVRLAPRMLDDDNLRSAFKYIRDEISEFFVKPDKTDYINSKGKKVAMKGHWDSDSRIIWTYDQRKHSIQCIEITITPTNEKI